MRLIALSNEELLSLKRELRYTTVSLRNNSIQNVYPHAGMMSGDMQREQGRRDWEEEAQRRYELEQLAEADRDQRVDVSSCYLCPVLLKCC